MEVNQSVCLLDLPNEMLEKIVDFLPHYEHRKNLRFTCQRLLNLCNSERYCRNEVFKMHPDDFTSTFHSTTRGCINLIFRCYNSEYPQINPFFEQHGAKVFEFSFKGITFPPGLLELVITHCERLCYLKIDYCRSFEFSMKQVIVARPTVTSLKLKGDIDDKTMKQSLNFISQIPSIFPCMKHLTLELYYPIGTQRILLDSVILDSIVNLHRTESLNLHLDLGSSPSNDHKFLNLLSKYAWRKLGLSFERGLSSIVRSPDFWMAIASRLNSSSIKLRYLSTHHQIATNIKSLLSVTNLSHLYFDKCELHLTMDFFNACVSSKLKTIKFNLLDVWVHGIQTDLPSKANVTVTDLDLDWTLKAVDSKDLKSSVMTLFTTYFCGLVHLKIMTATDEVLQKIFKYQKNLRSLVIESCWKCSITGFCGTNDEQFGNSINNLQNLEHLTILGIDAEIMKTENFQTEFNFPRLKYLRMSQYKKFAFQKLSEVPINMLKSCDNLEAVLLDAFNSPSTVILSPLFQILKRLDYLRIYRRGSRSHHVRTYVNLKRFSSVDVERFSTSCYPAYYDANVDRTVFTITSRNILFSPKISTHKVHWIVL